jgi:heme-degrading monooxygenase HmoA
MSSYELPDDTDEAASAFGSALAQVRECPGFIDGYYLVSCDEDRVVTFTLWETRDAMEASRVTASRLRSDAARQVGIGVVRTEEFRVEPAGADPVLERLRVDVNSGG